MQPFCVALAGRWRNKSGYMTFVWDGEGTLEGGEGCRRRATQPPSGVNLTVLRGFSTQGWGQSGGTGAAIDFFEV